MNDLNCPYCNAENEVCHDDGQGYDESELHEMECSSCDKYFTFETSISYYYEPYKADCLNGQEHKLKPTITIPKQYTKMSCADCEYSREPTQEERLKHDIPEMVAAKTYPQNERF